MDAVAGLSAGDAAHAQALAFAVAQAVREGDEHALPALTHLLTGSPEDVAFDEGTLLNILSALQFAAMLAEAHRADWTPPTHAIARAVQLGLGSGGALREQTEGLLWALVNLRLAADWLGRDAANSVASLVSSSDLREGIVNQLRTLISLVAGGEEFPCVPA